MSRFFLFPALVVKAGLSGFNRLKPIEPDAPELPMESKSRRNELIKYIART